MRPSRETCHRDPRKISPGDGMAFFVFYAQKIPLFSGKAVFYLYSFTEEKEMLKRVLSLMAALLVILSLAACKAENGQSKDQKSVQVHVIVASEKIDKTYDLKTSQQFVRGVLEENSELGAKIENGFLTTLEGYTASNDKREYFNVQVNGEDAMKGVAELEVKDGDVYTFEVRTY
jgi:hypothetical protein